MRIINTIKGSTLLKSGITVTAAKGSVIVANFLIFYILVRICSPEDFGTWVLYTSLIAIFDIAVSSFIGNAIIKFYSDYQDDAKGKFVFNSITFAIFLILVVSLLLYLSIFLFNELYRSDLLSTLLWLGPLILFPSGVITVMNCIEQGNSRFYGQLVSSVIRSGIFIFYLLYLFITGSHYKLQHFVFVNIAAALMAMVVIFAMTKKYFTLTYSFDSSIIRNIANYGFFTFGIEVIGQISNNIGQLISGALLSPAAVGIINVASRVLQFIEIPLQSISTLLMPKGVVTHKEQGMAGIRTLYEKSSALIVVTMLPVLILFFIFAEEIIYVLSGDNFGEAASLLRIIIIYSILKPFGRNAGVILNAIGKTRVNFLMILIPTVINLGLNYYLIKQMGVIGSPIATLVSVLVGFVFNQYVLNKLAGVQLRTVGIQIVSYYKTIYKRVSLK